MDEQSSPAPAARIVNTVRPGSFLTLHYRLAGPDGRDIVNTFGEQPATLTLGTGALAPAIEQCLVGLPEGAHQSFELEAGAAFGERNSQMVQRLGRAVLQRHGEPDEDYAPGDVVRFAGPNGEGAVAGVVRAIGDDWVEFDFNHPLAGAALKFEVKLIGVL
jgi:FKBP-type peptidyl-prolyl cis-trans isomerase SlpA